MIDMIKMYGAGEVIKIIKIEDIIPDNNPKLLLKYSGIDLILFLCIFGPMYNVNIIADRVN